jgi:hypothetical protein
MNLYEFNETYELILRDAAAIAHNQQALAGIHTQLERNMFSPFEQDFIYEDHFGQLPSEPRIFNYRGVTITSRINHQTGFRLSDIAGADLLYEIVDEKFALIQYKKANNGSVKNDVAQLEVLLGNCPEVCPNQKKRPLPIEWVPLKLNSFCGIWYCVHDGAERRYVHACEAEAIFRGKRFSKGKLFQDRTHKRKFYRVILLMSNRRIIKASKAHYKTICLHCSITGTEACNLRDTTTREVG